MENCPYLEQANDFLKATETTLKIELYATGVNFNRTEKGKHDVYKCTLSKGGRVYTFDFTQSLRYSGVKHIYLKGTKFERETYVPLSFKEIEKLVDNPSDSKLKFRISRQISNYNRKLDDIQYPQAPNAYDVLACLDVYDCDTFEEFCDCFGYDVDSIKALEIFRAVQEQENALLRMFSSDELEQLQEIC